MWREAKSVFQNCYMYKIASSQEFHSNPVHHTNDVIPTSESQNTNHITRKSNQLPHNLITQASILDLYIWSFPVEWRIFRNWKKHEGQVALSQLTNQKQRYKNHEQTMTHASQKYAKTCLSPLTQ